MRKAILELIFGFGVCGLSLSMMKDGYTASAVIVFLIAGIICFDSLFGMVRS